LRAASGVAGAGVSSLSRSDAGISRFRSRSRMYSSYFAVPGRGGASAGIPPIAAGIASLTPAAIFSLIDPQPLRPQPARATVTMARIWRALVGIGRRYSLTL
jgi:hypothetical protein